MRFCISTPCQFVLCCAFQTVTSRSYNKASIHLRRRPSCQLLPTQRFGETEVARKRSAQFNTMTVAYQSFHEIVYDLQFTMEFFDETIFQVL